MQLLGRVSIISGALLVSLVNLVMFSDSSEMSENEKIITYGKIYLYSLIVPGISVIGVLFSHINSKSRLNELLKNGLAFEKAYNLIYPIAKITKPNPSIIIGSILFVIFTISIGFFKNSIFSRNCLYWVSLYNSLSFNNFV